jgi:argininosuccinate lyase
MSIKSNKPSDIRQRGQADPRFVDGDDEDVHSFVERVLVERVGDAGRRLHTGRSRNEQVSLDVGSTSCGTFPRCRAASRTSLAALAAQAVAAGDALMPAFTHFRPAQPVLVAHFFLAHIAPLRRDYQRLAAARDEADALTLGSGAVAGTELRDRRQRAGN